MKKAEGVIAWVSRVFNNIGMVFLTFLMLVITADVLLRDIFNRPLRGANEIAEFSMLLVVFLSVAFTQYVKSNIAVSILYDRFPKAAQLIIDIFVHLLCLCISGLIFWQAIQYRNYLAELNRTSLILELPEAPFQVIMIVGFFMLNLVLILDVINSVRKVLNR